MVGPTRQLEVGFTRANVFPVQFSVKFVGLVWGEKTDDPFGR